MNRFPQKQQCDSKPTKNQVLQQPRPLPWWRLGPVMFALILLVAIPSGFDSPSIVRRQASSTDSVSVVQVAFQQNESATGDASPEIELPEITLPEVNGDDNAESAPQPLRDQLRQSMSQDQLSAADLAAANETIQRLAPADWLGPLAPVALSPFFGITCLSGLALWSPEWMPGNGLLNSATPLKNPALFWSFAALTIITSLPRLSKVSKPIAAAVDKIEAYAGIITLIAIRYMTMPSEVIVDSPEIAEAGIVSSSIGALLYVAMVINVLVINSVKFFFEFLIWLTPVPFLDACFEVANKTVCGLLMAVYSFSPTLATLLNLAMFAVCLLLLRWISRRVRFYRHMMFDSLWPMFQRTYAQPRRAELVVFPKHDWSGFQDKACLTICREQDGWSVRQTRWLRTPLIAQIPANSTLRIRQGWLTNTLEISGDQPVVLIFSRRYHSRLEEVAHLLGAEFELISRPVDRTESKAEFV
ncbi:MAG: hypothetical protein R3C05_18935 [Pirellulaceae bacterium]